MPWFWKTQWTHKGFDCSCVPCEILSKCYGCIYSVYVARHCNSLYISQVKSHQPGTHTATCIFPLCPLISHMCSLNLDISHIICRDIELDLIMHHITTSGLWMLCAPALTASTQTCTFKKNKQKRHIRRFFPTHVKRKNLLGKVFLSGHPKECNTKHLTVRIFWNLAFPDFSHTRPTVTSGFDYLSLSRRWLSK